MKSPEFVFCDPQSRTLIVTRGRRDVRLFWRFVASRLHKGGVLLLAHHNRGFGAADRGLCLGMPLDFSKQRVHARVYAARGRARRRRSRSGRRLRPGRRGSLPSRQAGNSPRLSVG